MKADAEQYQLRTTAARELDRAHRERKKYCWKRAKTKRILTGEELETKLNEALLRLADQGETGGQGWSLRGGGG